MADLRIAVICFNKYGAAVAEKMHAAIDRWKETIPDEVTGSWFVRNAINPKKDMFISSKIKTAVWTAERFKDTDVIIYICPSVQAVNHISESITDQMSDPAVLVVDEKGEYCVPLLAGKRGEANYFGEMLQENMGIKYVNPLIDDPKSRIDIIEYAAATNMVLSNTDYAKEINAAIESGHEVGFYTSYPVIGAIPDRLVWSSEAPLGIYISPSYHTAYFDHTLWLIPKCLVVGVVCGPEHSYKTVKKAIINSLSSISLYPEAISRIATLKGCETNAAIQSFAADRNIPIIAYDSRELSRIEKIGGITPDAVESAALKASEGKLIVGSVENDGITVCVAMENIHIKF